MHICRSILALLLCLCVSRLAAANDPIVRFAIVVGNNLPERSQFTKLHYADDDALAIHQLLVQAGVESVLLARLDNDTRQMNPDVNPSGPPSKQEVEASFAAVLDKIQHKAQAGVTAELLFVYSGHGDVDGGEGYVVLEHGRLTRTELHALLARSAATRNHVLVDACRSYFFAFDKGPGGRHVPFRHPFMGRMVPADLVNTGFVLSTSSDRDSHEWARLQSGILSHEIRSALRGAADVNLDGCITYAELGAFIQRANEAIPNPNLRPDVLVLPPGKDLKQEVLRWRPGTANVLFDGPLSEHVYVETARGARLLDAHPGRQQPLMLHVPEDRPLFVRSGDGKAEYVVEDLKPVVVAALQVTPAVGRKGSEHWAFEKLFVLPFGQEQVLDYERGTGWRMLDYADSRAYSSTSWQKLGRWSGALAIGAGAGALSLALVSAGQYHGAPAGTSQLQLQSRYDTGKRLEIAAIVLGGIAGASALTWGATKLWPDVSLSASSGDALLALGGRF